MAAIGLARILLARGEIAEARALLDDKAGVRLRRARAARPHRARGTRFRPPRTATDQSDAQTAIAAWTEGDVAQALELFQEIIASEPDPERRDLVRRIMVAIFTELGDDPLAVEHRRRLAAVLN